MAERMRLSGRWALITGAGSGIGRAIAISLARRGCSLILTDIHEENLRKTEEQCVPHGVQAARHLLDVSDRDSITGAAREIARDFGKIDLLVNNAGVGLAGSFEQVPEEDFDWLFNINFFGVVRMCRAFLPLLRKSDDARIVNLSSIFGIVAPPGQAAYVASKFAVRGFSQSLARELEGTSVGVTTVHPGGVATSIADHARIPASLSPAERKRIDREGEEFKKLLSLSPAIAGEVIVKAVESRKSRVLVGNDARLVAAIERIAPVAYWDLIKPRVSAR